MYLERVHESLSSEPMGSRFLYLGVGPSYF